MKEFKWSNHDFYMSLAYEEALKAQKEGEVPVGAVIVKDAQVISRAYNQKESHQQTANHAEMLAIQKANVQLKSWRLEKCQIYVTLEPCLMCIGAIQSARFQKLIYGCKDPKIGAGRLLNHLQQGPKVDILSGVMETECTQLLKTFFKNLRE